MAEPRKKKPVDDDDVQKVVLEDVGPKARAAHEKVVEEAKASAFTKEVWLALFGSVVAITTTINAYFQYRQNELARTAAVEVKGVKETLTKSTTVNEENMKDLKKTTDATHAIVNSGSLVTLKLLAEVSRWKADRTGDPDHVKAAEKAENDVREHEAKQKDADDAGRNKTSFYNSRTHVSGERARFCSVTRVSPKSRSGVALTA